MTLVALKRPPAAWMLAGTALIAAGVLAAVAFDLALRFSPLDPERYLRTVPSPILLDRNGRMLQASLNADDSWCFPRDLADHSKHLIDATIAAEDQRFRTHRGVDPLAIVRAAFQNVTGREIASGASTISMQVVKLADPHPRSLPGKIHQAWNALRLERAASKDLVLAAYLNRAPYGYNLIGADAAARRYFGKSSRELTIGEAALLAGLPKAPARLDPLRHQEAAKARRDYVLNRMHDEGYISTPQRDEALESPVAAKWHELPMDAPHLHGFLANDVRVRTTLDAEFQRLTQNRLAQYLKRFDGEITNAAAIAVETQTGHVLAYCGSADFFRSEGGQIDLARAARAPGSALKPFIYAVAMQRQRLYPSEMLLDDTLDYGDYSPANYDGEFTGRIPAEEALRYSLNVPAVQVLDRIGVATAHATLQSLGLTTLDRAPEHYGLGLALGNCEVRLDELTAAYRSLAANGLYFPLHYTFDASSIRQSRVFSEDIASAVCDMLRQPLPGELPSELIQDHAAATRVGHKTGTSTGHHDAWAFVFNRHYVVGVWLGNPDGRSSTRLVGAEAALPLAGEIFRSLPSLTTPAWPDATEAERAIRTCTASGLPAAGPCPQTEDAFVPRSTYLNRFCDVHRAASGIDTVIERWPGSARDWDLAAVRNPVPLDTSHGAVQAALRITAPSDGSQYVLTGKPGADRIRLAASIEHDQPVHWYCDGRYLGSSHTNSPIFLDLDAGTHAVACMVAGGATDSVTVTVHAAP